MNNTKELKTLLSADWTCFKCGKSYSDSVTACEYMGSCVCAECVTNDFLEEDGELVLKPIEPVTKSLCIECIDALLIFGPTFGYDENIFIKPLNNGNKSCVNCSGEDEND